MGRIVCRRFGRRRFIFRPYGIRGGHIEKRQRTVRDFSGRGTRDGHGRKAHIWRRPDESGVVSCYDKPTDRLLWQTSKKLSDGETNAVVKSLAIRDGCVYAAFEDKSVMRFAAADGIVQGVVSTNYIPENMIFSSGSSSLFAVYGKTGTKREVYLFRTDFAGSEASPVSWREYPKLDAGEYAVSSGGVETGVQGIFVSDEYVYVASDMYTVRRFSHEGMAEPYEEFSTKAEKLVCFYEVADGFAGVDLRGNFIVWTLRFPRGFPFRRDALSIRCAVRAICFTAFQTAW